MKKENIYVVIDSKKKQERAIEILQKAGERVDLKGRDMYLSYTHKYLKLHTSSGNWFIGYMFENRTQITLDELEILLTKKKKVRYRIKTQEEFEATCENKDGLVYYFEDTAFVNEMYHLFGAKLTKKETKKILRSDCVRLDLKNGDKDKRNDWRFTKEMITPIVEQPREDTDVKKKIEAGLKDISDAFKYVFLNDNKTDSQVNPTVIWNGNGKEYELVSYAQGNELLSKKDVSLDNFEIVSILKRKQARKD